MRKLRKASFDLFDRFKYYLPGVKDIFILFAMYILGAAIGNLVSAIIGLAAGMDFVINYGAMIVYPIQFIPVIIYASHVSARNEMEVQAISLDHSNFTPGKAIWTALACIVATLCTAVICEPVIYMLPKMPDWLKQMFDNLTGGPVWATLLCVAVFAPLFEEWLCRGLILRGLLTKMKPVWAIVISAAFFAIIHMNPWQAIPAFILGCLFGLVYYKTGSLKLTMLMHCVNNATSVLMLKLPFFAEKEYLWETFTQKWQYGLTLGLCAALLAMFVAKMICRKEECPESE